MKYEQDEQGSIHIYLDKDEWEDYGKQAGYFDEVKTASTETDSETTQGAIDSLIQLKNEVNEKLAALYIATNKRVEATVEPTKEVEIQEPGFTKENFPTLVEIQERDGLIPPFDKTSRSV